jgi:2-keto-4-pentenoate hydratase
LAPARVAGVLDAARAAGRTLDVPLSDEVELTLDDAYAIQRELTTLRLADGGRVVGWKLGYTSRAMREQLGIDAPNFGPLTDAMVLRSPGAVPGTALQPRVEPEIGLRLARDLEPSCTGAEVLAACSAAYACLEVVDSVWTGYRFRLVDNTADGSSAAWFVLGDEVPLDDLPALGVRLLVDGEQVAEATGAAAGGHPASGVTWLAEQVATRYGTSLAAGSLILTGGLTAAVPLDPGSHVTAEFSTRRLLGDLETFDRVAAVRR